MRSLTTGSILCLLLVASCSQLRPEGMAPGGHDWEMVLLVDPRGGYFSVIKSGQIEPPTFDPNGGVYFDRQSGQLFQNREFMVEPRCTFSEGLCVVQEHVMHPHRKGYIDKSGLLVIPFQYEYACDFHDGRACVTVGKADGIIDRSGRWIIEPGKYDDVRGVTEGRYAFRKGKSWGFLDSDGRVVIQPVYNKVSNFSEGLCCVKYDSNESAYIDRDGRVRIRLPNPEWIGYYTKTKRPRWEGRSFSEGLAAVKGYVSLPSPPEEWANWRSLPSGYYYGYISKDGRMAIEPRFGSAGDFSEGLAAVTITGDGLLSDSGEIIGGWSQDPEEPEPPPAWGFINQKGEVVIPMIYEKAKHFREGFAPVRVGGKWGYIDRTGRMVIGAGFEDAELFKNGVALVVLGDKIAYIDKTGRLLVRTELSGLKF